MHLYNVYHQRWELDMPLNHEVVHSVHRKRAAARLDHFFPGSCWFPCGESWHRDASIQLRYPITSSETNPEERSKLTSGGLRSQRATSGEARCLVAY